MGAGGGGPVWIEPFQGPGHTRGREDGLRGSVTLMVSVMHRLGSAGLPGSPPAGQQGICFSTCRQWMATDPLPARPPTRALVRMNVCKAYRTVLGACEAPR